MIFFSNNILNKIIYDLELDEITDKVEEFKNDNIMIFTYFNYGIINIDYIENLLNYESNKIAYYCFDNEFNIRNCPSCMIYSKQYDENTDEITYYILLISTQKRFRNMGYGTLLLDGFMNKINEETKNINKNVKVVLSALDEVVSYYQKYGFEVVDYNFDSYPYLQQFEKCDDTKMYSIMVLLVKELKNHWFSRND
jgi:ribosomal protein S18 acetylase RimI-like enzyme